MAAGGAAGDEVMIREMTEAEAFAAIGEAIGWHWMGFREWATHPDATASHVSRALWLQSIRDSERACDVSSRGFVPDALAYGKASTRAEAAADALNRYPYLWPVFHELLCDDDPHTWEARVAVKAAERYPGEEVTP